MSGARKWLKRRKGLVAFVALAAIAGSVYYVTNTPDTAEEGVTYRTEAASTGTLSVTIAGTGNVAVKEQIEIWPDSAGTVASIEATEGAAVVLGQVLFTIDGSGSADETARALASYRSAVAGVARSEVDLLKSQQDHDALVERSEDPSQTVTQDQIDLAAASLASSEAGLASSKSSQSSAWSSYEDAKAAQDIIEVLAPCDGTLASLDIEVGDDVSAAGDSASSSGAGSTTTAAATSSSAPALIEEEGSLGLSLEINEVDVPGLEVGQKATVDFDALPDVTLSGTVQEIDRVGVDTQGVVTYGCWIEFDTSTSDVRSGMSANATVITAVQQNALLVTNAAVKTDTDGNDYVQILDAATGEPYDVFVEVGL
ncbi:MAG: HlyD family secretion protein [Actinomycetota bacterium]|nr:HlyD family secretion protein [Actinomycetota bacterium]